VNNWLKGLFLYGNINKLIGQMVLLSIPIIIIAVLLWSSFMWIRVLVLVIFCLLGLVLFVRFIRWVLQSLGISKLQHYHNDVLKRPQFKLWWLVACLVVIFASVTVCTFTGVEPISTYVDKLRFGITCESMRVDRGRLLVIIVPTRVTSGMYDVTLFENGAVREVQLISWSSPEANLKRPKSVLFTLSQEESNLYHAAYTKNKVSWWKPIFDVRVNRSVLGE